MYLARELPEIVWLLLLFSDGLWCITRLYVHIEVLHVWHGLTLYDTMAWTMISWWTDQ